VEVEAEMRYQKADNKHPWMGLDNKTCTSPKYWCRLHEVWLSEDDVKRRKCKGKPTFDMISTYKCRCLEKKL